jgi:uncharacterized protein YcbK (DUF882 family)
MYGNHFSFKELIHTDTGLDNSVSCDNHLSNLATLWNTLNFIRKELGKPIFVNSAYRTPSVNKQVGGAKRSLHMQGRAADIRCTPEHMERLWQIIEQYNAEYGLSEKIKYSTFYHIAI